MSSIAAAVFLLLCTLLDPPAPNPFFKKISSYANLAVSPLRWLGIFREIFRPHPSSGSNTFILLLMANFLRTITDINIKVKDVTLWNIIYDRMYLSWVTEHTFASFIMAIPLLAAFIAFSFFL